MTIYAVGDIHGQLDMLKAVHSRIEADRMREGTKTAPVVFVGDYTDRGPDSRGVLDWMVDQLDQGAPFICLAGNHDHMMLSFVDPDFTPDPMTEKFDWLRENLGGRQTLESYGLKPRPWHSRANIRKAAKEAVPEAHLTFLANRPLSFEQDGVFFVHAGVDPEKPMSEQRPEDLLWVRDPFLESTKDHGALVVHGHSPARQIEHAGNRLNIDTGAGYGRPLSAVVIEGGKVFELLETGRREVIPAV